jgi:sterol desaturase/sphingolipid hydroxylase (fatty acid hydroxylase superfamily)
LCCSLGFLLERLPIPRVWALPLDRGQLQHELLGNLVFIALTSVCFFAALSGARFAQPTAFANAITFVSLLVGFQIYYYFLHRLLHTRALIRFHRWHHVSRVTTPLAAQSMSWFEVLAWAFGYAALPTLLSCCLPISLEAWTAYMAFNMLGNIIGHANVELLPKLPAPEQFALAANPSLFHALHHARWTGHFGFQSAALDRLFGTEWSDWPALHARVGAGRALTDLRARADELRQIVDK